MERCNLELSLAGSISCAKTEGKCEFKSPTIANVSVDGS
jgi:hypothetical protein